MAIKHVLYSPNSLNRIKKRKITQCNSTANVHKYKMEMCTEGIFLEAIFKKNLGYKFLCQSL